MTETPRHLFPYVSPTTSMGVAMRTVNGHPRTGPYPQPSGEPCPPLSPNAWDPRGAMGRTRMLRSHSHCPWVGQRVHLISAAPPKLRWTSSTYTPPLPGTHHGILGTCPRHPASTGWSALHHRPNTHVFATTSTPGSSTTPTSPAPPPSSTISLQGRLR